MAGMMLLSVMADGAQKELPQMSSTLDRWSPYALAVLRIVTALLFMEHGTQKLFGFPAPPEGGAPPLLSLFGIGAILEFVGSLLILVGLFTRPVAFVLAGEMAVAYWMFHAPRSLYPVLNGGDASILFCFVFLLLVFTGPGALSVDGARRPAGPRHSWER
jgi:putative oxidoreductase